MYYLINNDGLKIEINNSKDGKENLNGDDNNNINSLSYAIYAKNDNCNKLQSDILNTNSATQYCQMYNLIWWTSSDHLLIKDCKSEYINKIAFKNANNWKYHFCAFPNELEILKISKPYSQELNNYINSIDDDQNYQNHDIRIISKFRLLKIGYGRIDEFVLKQDQNGKIYTHELRSTNNDSLYTDITDITDDHITGRVFISNKNGELFEYISISIKCFFLQTRIDDHSLYRDTVKIKEFDKCVLTGCSEKSSWHISSMFSKELNNNISTHGRIKLINNINSNIFSKKSYYRQLIIDKDLGILYGLSNFSTVDAFKIGSLNFRNYSINTIEVIQYNTKILRHQFITIDLLVRDIAQFEHAIVEKKNSISAIAKKYHSECYKNFTKIKNISIHSIFCYLTSLYVFLNDGTKLKLKVIVQIKLISPAFETVVTNTFNKILAHTMKHLTKSQDMLGLNYDTLLTIGMQGFNYEITNVYYSPFIQNLQQYTNKNNQNLLLQSIIYYRYANNYLITIYDNSDSCFKLFRVFYDVSNSLCYHEVILNKIHSSNSSVIIIPKLDYKTTYINNYLTFTAFLRNPTNILHIAAIILIKKQYGNSKYIDDIIANMMIFTLCNQVFTIAPINNYEVFDINLMNNEVTHSELCYKHIAESFSARLNDWIGNCYPTILSVFPFSKKFDSIIDFAAFTNDIRTISQSASPYVNDLINASLTDIQVIKDKLEYSMPIVNTKLPDDLSSAISLHLANTTLYNCWMYLLEKSHRNYCTNTTKNLKLANQKLEHTIDNIYKLIYILTSFLQLFNGKISLFDSLMQIVNKIFKAISCKQLFKPYIPIIDDVKNSCIYTRLIIHNYSNYDDNTDFTTIDPSNIKKQKLSSHESYMICVKLNIEAEYLNVTISFFQSMLNTIDNIIDKFKGINHNETKNKFYAHDFNNFIELKSFLEYSICSIQFILLINEGLEKFDASMYDYYVVSNQFFKELTRLNLVDIIMTYKSDAKLFSKWLMQEDLTSIVSISSIQQNCQQLFNDSASCQYMSWKLAIEPLESLTEFFASMIDERKLLFINSVINDKNLAKQVEYFWGIWIEECGIQELLPVLPMDDKFVIIDDRNYIEFTNNIESNGIKLEFNRLLYEKSLLAISTLISMYNKVDLDKYKMYIELLDIFFNNQMYYMMEITYRNWTDIYLKSTHYNTTRSEFQEQTLNYEIKYSIIKYLEYFKNIIAYTNKLLGVELFEKFILTITDTATNSTSFIEQMQLNTPGFSAIDLLHNKSDNKYLIVSIVLDWLYQQDDVFLSVFTKYKQIDTYYTKIWFNSIILDVNDHEKLFKFILYFEDYSFLCKKIWSVINSYNNSANNNFNKKADELKKSSKYTNIKISNVGHIDHFMKHITANLEETGIGNTINNTQHTEEYVFMKKLVEYCLHSNKTTIIDKINICLEGIILKICGYKKQNSPDSTNKVIGFEIEQDSQNSNNKYKQYKSFLEKKMRRVEECNNENQIVENDYSNNSHVINHYNIIDNELMKQNYEVENSLKYGVKSSNAGASSSNSLIHCNSNNIKMIEKKYGDSIKIIKIADDLGTLSTTKISDFEDKRLSEWFTLLQILLFQYISILDILKIILSLYQSNNFRNILIYILTTLENNKHNKNEETDNSIEHQAIASALRMLINLLYNSYSSLFKLEFDLTILYKNFINMKSFNCLNYFLIYMSLPFESQLEIFNQLNSLIESKQSNLAVTNLNTKNDQHVNIVINFLITKVIKNNIITNVGSICIDNANKVFQSIYDLYIYQEYNINHTRTDIRIINSYYIVLSYICNYTSKPKFNKTNKSTETITIIESINNSYQYIYKLYRRLNISLSSNILFNLNENNLVSKNIIAIVSNFFIIKLHSIVSSIELINQSELMFTACYFHRTKSAEFKMLLKFHFALVHYFVIAYVKHRDNTKNNMQKYKVIFNQELVNEFNAISNIITLDNINIIKFCIEQNVVALKDLLFLYSTMYLPAFDDSLLISLGADFSMYSKIEKIQKIKSITASKIFGSLKEIYIMHDNSVSRDLNKTLDAIFCNCKSELHQQTKQIFNNFSNDCLTGKKRTIKTALDNYEGICKLKLQTKTTKDIYRNITKDLSFLLNIIVFLKEVVLNFKTFSYEEHLQNEANVQFINSIYHYYDTLILYKSSFELLDEM